MKVLNFASATSENLTKIWEILYRPNNIDLANRKMKHLRGFLIDVRSLECGYSPWEGLMGHGKGIGGMRKGLRDFLGTQLGLKSNLRFSFELFDKI